jgi:LPS sulfotransferase NodH
MERRAKTVYRAVRAYGPRPALRFVAPDRRFVILTAGRTGSELLVSLLDSHPEIRCDSEILGVRRQFPGQLIASRTALAGLRGARAFGFKLLRTHLLANHVADPGEFVRDLHRDGFHVIVLERRDLLSQAVSYVRASGGHYHHRRDSAAAFTPQAVDPIEVLTYMFTLEQEVLFARNALAGIDHLTLRYEDDLADPSRQQLTADRVCAVLGLDPQPVRSDLVRVTPHDVREQVENYAELAAALAGTRYACWLETGAGAPTPEAGTPRYSSSHSGASPRSQP